MGDPLSTAVTILTALPMVTKSIIAIFKAIDDLREHYKIIQDLWDQLIALDIVLCSLHEACGSDDTRFPLLAFPLERCRQACEQFSSLIKKCTVHSDGSRASIRDWATLKYMGSDISGCLRMLDGYKMTICIALETDSIRGSQVTIEHIRLYQKTISTNVKALERRLAEMNNKLDFLTSGGHQGMVFDTAERTQILEEKASIQSLIDICLQASQYLDKCQDDIANTKNVSSGPEALRSAKQLVTQTLEMCERELINASAGIRAEAQSAGYTQNSMHWTSQDIITERQLLEEELRSVRQQLAVCAESNEVAEQQRQLIFERISPGKIASQTIASNRGDSIIARDVRGADRTFQALGQFDSHTLQQLSTNHAASSAPPPHPSGVSYHAPGDNFLQPYMTNQHGLFETRDETTSTTSREKAEVIRSEVRSRDPKSHSIRSKMLGLVRCCFGVSHKAG